MDKVIEQMAHSCSRCKLQMYAQDSPKLTSFEWKSGMSLEQIHIDLACNFKGEYFIVVVDLYTIRLEVQVVPSTKSRTVIEVLH